MMSLIWSRIPLVWFLLVVATAASWGMGHGLGFQDTRQASLAVILTAFVKVRFVILDFMEMRHAPVWMRLVSETWVVMICGTVALLYWLGSGQVQA
jgi:hypothetical protein